MSTGPAQWPGSDLPPAAAHSLVETHWPHWPLSFEHCVAARLNMMVKINAISITPDERIECICKIKLSLLELNFELGIVCPRKCGGVDALGTGQQSHIGGRTVVTPHSHLRSIPYFVLRIFLFNRASQVICQVTPHAAPHLFFLLVNYVRHA